MKYITTPIYYANDAPHIGHAVTTLAADVLHRYWKLTGEDSFLLTGTDEHGAKMSEASEKAGLAPQAFVDSIAPKFAEAWQNLNIGIDGFIRTTNPKHEAVVTDFLTRLYDSGAIYKGSYKGWYCVGCEEFKTETQIGPNNTCLIHLRPLIELEEEAYLFKLSEYKDRLVELMQSDTLKIQPESRKNEVLGFLTHDDLRDIAISRKSVEWGIPVPWDKNHTVYVWIDALLAYYSACQSNGPEFKSEKRPDWPASLHLIGKDILRFHAIIWPAMLLAASEKLPESLFVHGYFTVEGQKMSKSLGNVITPQQLIDRYGIDGTRYLLLATVPFGADGDISHKRLDELYTSDLANNIGNLVNRIQNLIERYCDAAVPALATPIASEHGGEQTEFQVKTTFDTVSLTHRLLQILDKVKMLNQYIEQQAPWQLAKAEKQEQVNQVMAYLAEGLFVIGVWLYPFLPHTSQKIVSLFGSSINEINYATLLKQNHTAGKKITPVEPLFPRLA